VAVPLPVPTHSDLDASIVAAAARRLAETGPISFLVEDEAITYVPAEDRVLVREGDTRGPTAVRLSRRAWEDLTTELRTFINLFLSKELTFERGGFRQLADWDPVLRYLQAGIPPYDPARSDFGERDPNAIFEPGCDDSVLKAQLDAIGFLHVRGCVLSRSMQQPRPTLQMVTSSQGFVEGDG